MNGDEIKTDVVVVGMPSCGKTVFFTVLGKKFTSLVDGRSAAPLGFRMSTCDKATANVVSEAYDRLLSGRWPESTKEGQVMPLRWEVFTGRRRIFELYSMDIAGETFKKAFGIEDGKVSPDEKDTASPHTKSKRKNTRGDSELFVGQSVSEETADGPAEAASSVAQAAVRLKEAVKAAKVVCFMVNIAVPDRREGRTFDEADETKWLRFRSSVMNMFLSLKERPELRAKSIIVLTQSHQHEGEIERAGGPVMYLADMCGGEGAELSNLAKEYNVPVIAVSAINEERDSNELPRIYSPRDIPSSGLFGFLLMVAGTVVDGDGLAHVKDAYFKYQRERVEYLKSPTLEVKLRLQQARRYRDASVAYVEACNAYLDDIGNLEDVNGAASLPPGTQRMYKHCTNADPEVKAATDREYLVRDELWDRALRRAAVCRKLGSADPVPDRVYAEVQEGLLERFPEKQGNAANKEFVYGFGEEDLLSGTLTPTFTAWIDLNIREYVAELDSDIANLAVCEGLAATCVEDLETHVGGDDFDRFREKAESSYGAFVRKIADFQRDWFDNGEVLLSDVKRMDAAAAALKGKIDMAMEGHAAIRLRNERRQVARAAARRRLKVIATLLALMAIGAGLLFLVRTLYDKRNQDVVQRISGAISRSDYAYARQLCDSLVSVEWLHVDRYDHLCANFPQRLILAAEIQKVRTSAEALMKKLEEQREWLDAVRETAQEVDEGKNMHELAKNAYKALPQPASFDDIMRQDVDFRSKLATAKSCTDVLTNSIAAIERIQQGWDEHLRQKRFNLKIHRAKEHLKKIQQELEKVDEELYSHETAEMNSLMQDLQKLTGDNEADKRAFAELQKSVAQVLAELKKRLDEKRKKTFVRMLADVRDAIASNSVNEAWSRYDAALACPEKPVGASEELVSLRKVLQDRTASECGEDLQDVEAMVNEMLAAVAFSDKTIATTRKARETLETVQEGMSRIPYDGADFSHLESQIQGVLGKLPRIVQIDGEDELGQPQDVAISDPAPNLLEGKSPETGRKCIYVCVMPEEFKPGNTKLVWVLVNGQKGLETITLSKLSPGINRQVKRMKGNHK